ncbi:hypothetical protein CAEBREN_02288 [Caenorhabditis brenneri]|uniref:Uncharacterized protein n=1 Tax=Caenorhabditis brenneri TaxID=135651 RepID=G0NXF3_CAEBE|nr:hypothetical protein CAEBREN_02288 [Caenorhabditis brenneri]
MSKNWVDTPGGSEKAVEYLEQAITIVSESIDAGRIVSSSSSNDVCKVLAAVGSILSIGIKTNFHDTDVAEKFDQLAEKIKQLEDRIIESYDKLKDFISESAFIMKTIGEVDGMKQLLMDVIHLREKETVENFKDVYEQKTPLKIGYSMLSLLDQNSTNPLDLGKTYGEDSQKSLRAICNILIGDLIFLEAIASGLFKKLNMYDCERLIGGSIDVTDLKEDEDSDYEAWDQFSDDFDDFVKEVVQSGKSTHGMAEMIQEKLEDECPNESFYICVFENAKIEQDYYYYIENQDNLLEAKNVESKFGDKFNVLVYRSENAHEYSEEEYNALQEEMKFLSGFDHNKTNKQIVDEQMAGRSDIGFAALINYDRGAQILSTNSPDYASGPGNWTQVWLGGNQRGVNFVIGYP